MVLHVECTTVLAACSSEQKERILLHDCQLPARHRSPRRGPLLPKPKKTTNSFCFKSPIVNGILGVLFLVLAYMFPLLQEQAIHKQWPNNRDWVQWSADLVYGCLMIGGFVVSALMTSWCCKRLCCVPRCGICCDILCSDPEDAIEPMDSPDSE